jgi:hypothetical protein
MFGVKTSPDSVSYGPGYNTSNATREATRFIAHDYEGTIGLNPSSDGQPRIAERSGQDAVRAISLISRFF